VLQQELLPQLLPRQLVRELQLQLGLELELLLLLLLLLQRSLLARGPRQSQSQPHGAASSACFFPTSCTQVPGTPPAQVLSNTWHGWYWIVPTSVRHRSEGLVRCLPPKEDM